MGQSRGQSQVVSSNGYESAKIPATYNRGTEHRCTCGPAFAPPRRGAARVGAVHGVVPRRYRDCRCARRHPRKRADRACVRTTKDNNILRKTNCQVSIYERRARSSAAEHAPIHLHGAWEAY